MEAACKGGLAGIGLLAGIFASAVSAAPWQPELLASEAGYRAPDDDLRITLPAEVSAQELAGLSLELDGIDVTALVLRDGASLSYQPPQPLAPGEHELRLLEYGDDGSIVERGQWRFRVRQSLLFESSSWQARADLNGSYRLADRHLPEPAPNRSQADGALALSGELADRDWGLKADASFLYNSRPELTVQGDRFDLGEYLVSGRYRNAYARLGHQLMGPESLLLGGFNRRGASAGFTAFEERVGFSGFSMRTGPIVGFGHGLGVDDPEQRTNGLVLSARPLGDPETLTLAAVHVDGEGSSSGVGTGGDLDDPSNEATGVLAESLLLDRRLRLRGEAASSRTDFDGDGTLEPTDDRAHSLLVVYAPQQPADLGGHPATWNVGVEHRRIGTYFSSLGNPSLPSDRQGVRAFGDLLWNGFSANLSAGRETDNVDGIDGVPTVATRQLSLRAGYAPQPDPEGPAGWRLFAQPNYSLSLAETRQEQLEAAEDDAWPTDRRLSDAQLSVYFFPDPWSWGAGVGVNRYDDYGDASPDTRNQLIFLTADLPLGERLRLGPELQASRLRYEDSGESVSSLMARLSVQAELLPERLRAALSLSLNQDSASDDSLDGRQLLAEASLHYVMWTPTPDRPSATWFLSGSWQDSKDNINPTFSSDLYQVFTGLNVSWAGAR